MAEAFCLLPWYSNGSLTWSVGRLQSSSGLLPGAACAFAGTVIGVMEQSAVWCLEMWPINSWAAPLPYGVSEKSGFGVEPRVFLVFLSCYFDREQRPGRVLLYLIVVSPWNPRMPRSCVQWRGVCLESMYIFWKAFQDKLYYLGKTDKVQMLHLGYFVIGWLWRHL